LEERDQLEIKVEKLKTFILLPTFEDLSPIDKQDLRAQLVHMTNYLRVLNKRCSRLCN